MASAEEIQDAAGHDALYAAHWLEALLLRHAAMAEALAHFSLGILQEGLANGSALESYRRALEEKPDYDPLYVRTAVLYIKQGQTDKAIALMKEA